MLVPRTLHTPDRVPPKHRSVVIFGSTGSIGRATLEVIRAHRDLFTVRGIVGFQNIELLASQVREFNPNFVACDEIQISALRSSLAGSSLRVGSVSEAESWLHHEPKETIVVAALVGVAGIRSVLAALKAGQNVALANKEALISGGVLVREALIEGGGSILPVDSEHSAIFQVLHGERTRDLAKLILTASGGPFLKTPLSDLSKITPEQAIKHPRWNMGAKISVDSATMMNKGLELIEAHWLFGLSEPEIDVVVHPESIIHSLLQLNDGVLLAQASTPDMRGPIAYALNFPFGRLGGLLEPISLPKLKALHFFELDSERFPAVNLARQALKSGGASSAVMNIANEEAVARFLLGRLSFDKIIPTAEEMMAKFEGRKIQTLDDLEHLNREVRGACH